MVDYSYEITKALKAMTSTSYTYVDNNHTAFTKRIGRLKTYVGVVAEGYKSLGNDDLKDYSDLKLRKYEMRTQLYSKMYKRQIRRVKSGESLHR